MDQSAKILRFACVGATVALLYVALYLGLLTLGLAQPVANGAAFLLAVAVQYAGQAAFTFRAPLKDGPQITRFVAMIGCGLLSSALITGIAQPALGLPHWGAAAIVTLVLPIQNYLIMSRWVFAHGSSPAETSQ
ncbi:GtrA family protein [uncultured Tateyamaria sp.]|uniref:GtrA family protein n=1 Tax=uncultured Tateyamaria sp. TaxID=455651 RepID=UPI002633AB84|nr:GtrA family protein [uncultured Tateyamaria sp.]